MNEKEALVASLLSNGESDVSGDEYRSLRNALVRGLTSDQLKTLHKIVSAKVVDFLKDSLEIIASHA